MYQAFSITQQKIENILRKVLDSTLMFWPSLLIYMALFLQLLNFYKAFLKFSIVLK